MSPLNGFVTARKAARPQDSGSEPSPREALHCGRLAVPVPQSQCSVLLEQLPLRGGLGLLSTSDDEDLEVWRVSGRSSSGWLGALTAVMKEAGNLSQLGDDGEQAHAPATAETGSTSTAKVLRSSSAEGR